MYASTRQRETPIAVLFRDLGRVSGMLIVVYWLAMVVKETIRIGPPAIENYYQGAMLAVVFVGYAVGWRHEFLGGVMAIIGTMAFITLNLTMFGAMPIAGAIGFAVPGVFYLIAHYLENRRPVRREWRP